jgi:hypothetical protein
MQNKQPASATTGALNKWETVREASQRVSVSPRHLRELMRTGLVPWYRFGKRRVVLDPVEVDQTIRRQLRKAA